MITIVYSFPWPSLSVSVFLCTEPILLQVLFPVSHCSPVLSPGFLCICTIGSIPPFLYNPPWPSAPLFLFQPLVLSSAMPSTVSLPVNLYATWSHASLNYPLPRPPISHYNPVLTSVALHLVFLLKKSPHSAGILQRTPDRAPWASTTYLQLLPCYWSLPWGHKWCYNFV